MVCHMSHQNLSPTALRNSVTAVATGLWGVAGFLKMATRSLTSKLPERSFHMNVEEDRLTNFLPCSSGRERVGTAADRCR